jgi:hypothetical protein
MFRGCQTLSKPFPYQHPRHGNSAWQYRKGLIVPLMFLVSKKSSDPILNKQYMYGSHMPLLSSEAFIANITDNILQSKAI